MATIITYTYAVVYLLLHSTVAAIAQTKECGTAKAAAAGPAKEGNSLATKAVSLLNQKNYNGAASTAASAAQMYSRAAQCYANQGMCIDAASAAKSAASAYKTASDAALAASSDMKGVKQSAEDAKQAAEGASADAVTGECNGAPGSPAATSSGTSRHGHWGLEGFLWMAATLTWVVIN